MYGAIVHSTWVMLVGYCKELALALSSNRYRAQVLLVGLNDDR